jgi:hypothetical protein
VISLEDLIKTKEALGRERDLLAAKELRAIAAKRRQGRSSNWEITAGSCSYSSSIVSPTFGRPVFIVHLPPQIERLEFKRPALGFSARSRQLSMSYRYD